MIIQHDKLLFIIIFIAVIVATTLPIILIKRYDISHDYRYILLSIICYTIVIITYVYLFKRSKISMIYPMLKVFTVVLVILSGVLLFKEELTTLQKVGLALGIIAIYLR